MTPTDSTSLAARQAGPAELAVMLADSRAQTLAVSAAYEAALPGLSVPQRAELNPPLWELGHIGWFQEWWIGRNPERGSGAAANPDAPRSAAWIANADALYDSSAVPHATRWSLPLPDAPTTRDALARGLARSLDILARTGSDDRALYFHRLALFHEDMHNEAAIYMANHLGFAVPGVREPRVAPQGSLRLPSTTHMLGWVGGGFAFDNELAAVPTRLDAFEIDTAPVSNARVVAFIDAGGYGDPRLWSEAGRTWLLQTGAQAPRFWRRAGSGWVRDWFGQQIPLAEEAPALNLSCYEAEAWCAWAGRRLPTEAEWECAATSAPGFAWGEAWEWTASPFVPYAGFAPHPYRDYSAPWFGSRRVLRGGSVATHARMRHPRYRNFFTPERNDIFAGFRSCAL